MNREEIYSAAFAQVQALVTSGDLVTASRRLVLAEELGAEYMPAVFQNQLTEQPIQYGLNGPQVWAFDVEWYVYVYQNDTSVPSSPLLNNLLDKLLPMLGNDSAPGTFVTASGLVCARSLNGPVLLWEGLLGARAVARMSVRILVPTN